ncbi:MAG: hypothetical protein UHN47_07155 [Lachnospiraceae bacterium]|nr:hypothetical protein [Lachnospiraceae bacterium]
MEITFEQGLYIATYLMKGAFVKNHRDICISICSDAEVGIAKRGKNYNLYIKYAGKTQYNGKDRFTNEIEADELAALIIEAISNCEVLQGLEFNTTIMPVNNQHSQPVQNTGNGGNNENDDYKELVHKIEEEMADDDEYELLEPLEEIEESEPEKSDIPYIPEKYDKPEYVQSLVGEVVEMDDEVDIPVTQEQQPKEKKKNAPATATLPVPNNRSSKIAETSYIYRISTDHEMKQHMHMVIDKLVKENKELATELYINAMVTLLTLYNNDINKMAEETGIDKRDITLAYYEQQMIQK